MYRRDVSYKLQIIVILFSFFIAGLRTAETEAYKNRPNCSSLKYYLS
jgi:hypothetical protein